MEVYYRSPKQAEDQDTFLYKHLQIAWEEKNYVVEP